jgi:hypothetical protein
VKTSNLTVVLLVDLIMDTAANVRDDPEAQEPSILFHEGPGCVQRLQVAILNSTVIRINAPPICLHGVVFN